MNIQQKVEVYIRLRDRRTARKKAFDAEDASDKSFQEKIDAQLMTHLNANGIDRVGCESGTVYKSVRTSATVADWELTLKFIQDKAAWDLLERRVSKKAIEEYVNENESLPPGVNISREAVINVRRT
jgi:hypothetical protein